LYHQIDTARQPALGVAWALCWYHFRMVLEDWLPSIQRLYAPCNPLFTAERQIAGRAASSA
jgi:hypothetical protein